MGDEDSSSQAALNQNSTYTIEKWSDLNHVKKSLTSAMYKLKMNRKLIKYFATCFSIAVKTNKNNSNKIRESLQQILPHSYGNHENCTDWCEFTKQGSNYKHKYLPNQKPLKDDEFKKPLTDLFDRFAMNADKLAPCGSSQANESFDFLVSKKHPKNKHYAGSESFCYRLASAVCQKNEGILYIKEIFKLLKIKFYGVGSLFREKKEKGIKRKIEISKTISAKRRRIQLKENRCNRNLKAVSKEGLTYESESGLYISEHVVKNLKIPGSLQTIIHLTNNVFLITKIF